MNLGPEKYSSPEKLIKSLEDRGYKINGTFDRRVAYTWLWDADTGIMAKTNSHPWVFIEPDEDWYSIAFTRSTTNNPRDLPAPQRIFASKHNDHDCPVGLREDASIFFISQRRLTPTRQLLEKVRKSTSEYKTWESRIRSLSTRNAICIERHIETVQVINICATARKPGAHAQN